MLCRLTIKDYAIIENVAIAFGEGLNIITGETGAGKSIVIGALGLLLGEQASVEYIRKDAVKCFVEGVFSIAGNAAAAEFLKNQDLEPGNEIIVRREILAGGKSRCFVDDSPVPVYLLKQLGNLLVDLHGQHQHQSLLDPENYYLLVDSYGNLLGDAQKMLELFRQVRDLDARIGRQKEKAGILKEKKDLMQYQLKELAQIDPQPGEDESIEQELNILENREKIWELSQESYQMLYEREGSVAEQLRQVEKNLEDLKGFDAEAKFMLQYIEEAKNLIQDAAKNLMKYSDPDSFDPGRLEELRSRINVLIGLKRKYKATIGEILQKKADLERELAVTDSLNYEIGKLEKERKSVLVELIRASVALSGRRIEAALRLGTAVTESLGQLGMKDAIFEAKIIPQESPSGMILDGGKAYAVTEHGIDRVEFLIATNKGEDPKPLAKIASGGEISRVMLSIKNVLAGKDGIPVLVFDEIDTGISGRIASIVARKLAELSLSHQLVCITHLPQIACVGKSHFTAEKVTSKGRVKTSVRRLTYEERKVEIAKLLGGEELTKTNLKNAEELLKAGLHG